MIWCFNLVLLVWISFVIWAVWPGLPMGTKSLLVGVHQFAWHPVTVYVAWCKLYGHRPTWREAVCIIVHDWGYWGCDDMDGDDGELHPYVGAKIAKFLFGDAYHELVLNHSRFLCKSRDVEPSKLCWADKVSMFYDPMWFYLFRARLTGELAQYRKSGVTRNGIPLHVSDAEWLHGVRKIVGSLAKEKRAQYR